MACSPPGSSTHGILKAKVLEWVVIPFSRGYSRPRGRTWSPALRADALPSEPAGKPKAGCAAAERRPTHRAGPAAAGTAATCRGRHTHISERGPRGSARLGPRAAGSRLRLGVRVCSRIFLPLWRGLSGNVHRTECRVSSCCWKTEAPSWLDARGLRKCLVSRWFYFRHPAWPWQAFRRLPVVPF